MRKIKIGAFLLACCLMTGCMQGEESEMSEKQKQAKPQKQTMAVQSTEKPAETAAPLLLEKEQAFYSFQDMQADLKALEETYADKAALEVIGHTADGREIYDLVIGNTDAPAHIVIHGSIHAREYITTKLVMRQCAYYLEALTAGTGTYKGIPYATLFENVALHIIPMVNPDGVTLCQYGLGGLQTQTVRERVLEITALDGAAADMTYYRQWKANANGVDLNRNYDAMWEEFVGTGRPSSDRYKGTHPGSEPETAALIRVTTENPVKRTISYHTYGQVIYWYFGQEGDLYTKSKAFTDEMAEITGYAPDANYAALDPAGYKDWALDTLGIPSITIEVGYGQNPVPENQFPAIWEQNRNVWAGALYNLKYEGTNEDVL